MTRRPDIQGLRGIAVLSVIMFHAFGTILPGGFVGVDIFFVISGYLITTIIRREIETGSFSIAEFYRRRARRILPALAVVLLACLAVGYVTFGPDRFKKLGASVVATTFFGSNVLFWKTSGYFDAASELKPLLHTWSLAVEEQFYILYPPILLLMTKFAPRRTSIFLLLGACSSLLICEILLRSDASAAFYLTPPRGFELLIGALCAYQAVPSTTRTLSSNIIFAAGLALILGSLLFISPGVPFPGLAALAPCLGAAFIIQAGATVSPSVGTLLTRGPLPAVGNVSYSLYLWHWPILVFLRFAFGVDLSLTASLLAIALALCLAFTSYRFIEQPFLRTQTARIPVLSTAAALSVAFGLAGVFIFASKGIPSRFDKSAQQLFAFSEDFSPHRGDCHTDGAPIKPFERNCVLGDRNQSADLAIWGDSHGAELAIALAARAASAHRSVMQITSSACPPAIGFSLPENRWCVEQNARTLHGLVIDSHVRTVLLTANAFRYGPNTDLLTGFESSIKNLTTAGKEVVLVLQIPLMDKDPPEAAGFAMAQGKSPRLIGMKRSIVDRTSQPWREFLVHMHEKYGARLFDPEDRLCDREICHIFQEGVGVLYFNMDHLSVTGASFVVQPLADALYGKPN